MLKRSIRALTAVLVFLCLSATAPFDAVAPIEPIAPVEQHVRHTTLATWNVTRLGHGKQKDFEALGKVVREASFDFLALQEVMTEDGIEQLRKSVDAATGGHWQSMSSHAIGRNSYKEMYAFLWDSAVIEYVDGAVTFLDIGDRFSREPYSARFRIRDSGLIFVAANVHILFGENQSDRAAEVQALVDYWQWLPQVYPEDATRILLMGDFNLKPNHAAWTPMRAVAEPLIVGGASTLSTKDGVYANLYDNVWMPIQNTLPITGHGIFKFPAVLGLTHEEARRRVSDHAPVWLEPERISTGVETLAVRSFFSTS